MLDDLDRLAAAHGIVRSYVAIDGTLTQAPDGAVEALLDVLGADRRGAERLPEPPANWPPPPSAPEDAPCYLPTFLEEGRAWGVTCQLYGLSSARNWGIGDFEDLARLGETMARWGADFIGVNPLHALFMADPLRASPFSPSHRSFLNPLYIAVDQVDGFAAENDEDEVLLSALRQGALIDYQAVASHKLEVLRAIYDRACRAAPDPAFATFVGQGGEALRRYALFEALSLFMTERGCGAGWLSWPQPYREPEGDAVLRFAQDQAREVDFQCWLQWQADRQLGAVARRLRHAGMRIGLYLDLAVGTAPDGAATWSDRSLTVVGAEIGAPPDMFNPEGQSWGLAPVSPEEIVKRSFLPLRESYESILKHAGALRIDHAMSVYRLFWIPAGFTASEGAYILYPMADILRSLAAASQTSEAIIIGEDLGVVPKGFRAEMERVNALGYLVFYFERDEESFLPPAEWPRSALACVGSHDTSTLAGWWNGSDIDLRAAIGLFSATTAEEEQCNRQREKQQAVAALHALGERDVGESFDEAVAVGVHRLVASSPARLMAAQMEDLLGLVEQANLPGTIDQHPNWRRRLPVPVEAVAEVPMLQAVLKAIAEERPWAE